LLRPNPLKRTPDPEDPAGRPSSKRTKLNTVAGLSPESVETTGEEGLGTTGSGDQADSAKSEFEDTFVWIRPVVLTLFSRLKVISNWRCRILMFTAVSQQAMKPDMYVPFQNIEANPV
jgi:hypothetical protein